MGERIESIGQSFFTEKDGKFVVEEYGYKVSQDGTLAINFRVPSRGRIVYATAERTDTLKLKMFREAGPRMLIQATVDAATSPTSGLLRRRSVI